MNSYIHESRPDFAVLRRLPAALITIGVVALFGAIAPAKAQVMGDDACPKFAVDHAGFATCDGDRVAKAADARAAWADEVTPRQALALKQSRRAVFLDVRSRAEAALIGEAFSVDYVVPYRELALPMRWDAAHKALAMEPYPEFVQHVLGVVGALGGDLETPIVLICRNGDRSTAAATDLRAAGFTQVASVVGGIDGNATAAGWRKSGLPLVAVDKDQLFGLHE
jgi:rhodanese-related sulfurtransferase